MKMKSDFVTNSSSTSYIFSSTNKSHKKGKLIVEIDISKIDGVSIEEITWDTLEKIRENNSFGLSDKQLEQCKEILNNNKKAFYVYVFDDSAGSFRFLNKTEDITIKNVEYN